MPSPKIARPLIGMRWRTPTDRTRGRMLPSTSRSCSCSANRDLGTRRRCRGGTGPSFTPRAGRLDLQDAVPEDVQDLRLAPAGDPAPLGPVQVDVAVQPERGLVAVYETEERLEACVSLVL